MDDRLTFDQLKRRRKGLEEPPKWSSVARPALPVSVADFNRGYACNVYLMSCLACPCPGGNAGNHAGERGWGNGWIGGCLTAVKCFTGGFNYNCMPADPVDLMKCLFTYPLSIVCGCDENGDAKYQEVYSVIDQEKPIADDCSGS